MCQTFRDGTNRKGRNDIAVVHRARAYHRNPGVSSVLTFNNDHDVAVSTERALTPREVSSDSNEADIYLIWEKCHEQGKCTRIEHTLCDMFAVLQDLLFKVFLSADLRSCEGCSNL